jgi:hypothetical protein
MDKFGILGVRNAWYDPSKVTDHVIQGYTKVRFLHCIQENLLVINFLIMLITICTISIFLVSR